MNSRREFLQQLTVAVGAAVAAPVTPPVMAQESSERPVENASSSRTGSVAEALADFAITLRYEDLSGDVVRTTKRTILDTIGCAIGGYEAGPSRIAVKLAAAVSATPGA